MSNEKVYIYFDGKIKPPKNLDLSSKLNIVRDEGISVKRWSGRYVKISGGIVISIGAAIFLLILPCWAWLLIIGIAFILIGIHMYRSC